MALRVGFVGGGGITETHARAARELGDLEIAGFCGPNAEKTAALAREYGGHHFEEVERFVHGSGKSDVPVV